ncbi:MAG: Gfo/Idh/MocA family oxidoreductase [Gemmatimonadota bacterium]
MTNGVRLAFFGCGRATTDLHLPALRENTDIAVVALCDNDRDRLRLAGQAAPQARRYASLGEMLGDEAIDAVAVCTPPSERLQHVNAVLDAGKHLFVEKPLALTLADCSAIVARGKGSDRVAVVGFNMRQHRLLRAGRDVLKTGVLGTIEVVRCTFTTDIRLTRRLPAWRDVRQSGGGVISELATHYFDLWRWLLSEEVDEVIALSRTVSSDDSAALVSARLRSGALATLAMSERTTPMQEIEVMGDRGRMHLSLYDFDGLAVIPRGRAPGSVAARIHSILRTLRALPDGVRGLRSGGDYHQTYTGEWRAFADTIVRGAPPAATLEDGAAAAQIALAAAASAATGGCIHIHEFVRQP